MKTLETLFKVESLEGSAEGEGFGVVATLSHRRESEVYRGHFPGRPVTPGVLIIATAVELTALATEQPWRLQEVKNIKYLTMMSPDESVPPSEGCSGETFTVEATLAPDGTATVLYRKGEKQYAKMKLKLERGT